MKTGLVHVALIVMATENEHWISILIYHCVKVFDLLCSVHNGEHINKCLALTDIICHFQEHLIVLL
jgi:hypothetical protein